MDAGEDTEIHHWEKSETERPGVFDVGNVINKITDAPVLLGRLEPFRARLMHAKAILELGAGQGWASCLVRALYGNDRTVIASDISRYALQSLGMWEGIFRSRTSGGTACRSYQLPFADDSFDVVFAFQAAHHFRRLRESLGEMHRVLRRGGVAIWAHEPTCRRWIYPLAVRRVRAGRPEVPEDVLLYLDVLRDARSVGFVAACRDDCSVEKRRPLEFAYYAILGAVPPLRVVLPCTRDFVLEKK